MLRREKAEWEGGAIGMIQKPEDLLVDTSGTPGLGFEVSYGNHFPYPLPRSNT